MSLGERLMNEIVHMAIYTVLVDAYQDKLATQDMKFIAVEGAKLAVSNLTGMEPFVLPDNRGRK
jgi:hypothetical protein